MTTHEKVILVGVETEKLSDIFCINGGTGEFNGNR